MSCLSLSHEDLKARSPGPKTLKRLILTFELTLNSHVTSLHLRVRKKPMCFRVNEYLM